jgi:NAD(P)-dependent dehydrogenase (short-subunit alcohol dehydrogenase family)
MAEGQVIVTGASRGIGAAIAVALGEAGFDVVGLSRTGTVPAGRGIACDVTDVVAMKSVFAEIGEAGPVVGLVNNAGFHTTARSAALQRDDFEAVMRLNATAVMLAARTVYPLLQARGGGTIVNIGSFFDKLGVPENLAYCASKAAVGAITRCLAVEWAGDGISVLNVAPGYIETDLNRDFLARDSVRRWIDKRVPVGRPGRPEEVASLVAGLMTANNAFLTGETIYIDGGQGMQH